MGIASLWKFDANANDSVGAIHGTATGASYTPGIIGNAIDFPSSKDKYATFGNVYRFTTESFTVGIIINAASFISSKGIDLLGLFCNGRGSANGWHSYIASTGITVQTSQTGAVQSSLATFSFSVNKYYFILFTRNGSSIRIYIDGVDKTSTAATHINPATSDTYMSLNFVQYNYTVIGNAKFDEAFIEQRAWTASEVKNKYAYYKGFF